MKTQCQMVAKTDVGKQRFRNEDNFLILEEYNLAIVADGMGGHAGGNIASQTAVDTIKEIFAEKYEEEITNKTFQNEEEEIKAHESLIEFAIQMANDRIFKKNKGIFSVEAMGTTMVALQICGNVAISGCVGDSRIYLYRDEKFEQITEDHSLVGELLKYNIIAEKDLFFAHNKNIITRALGMNETVRVDIKRHSLKENDLFLLCSDGLSDLVNNDSIKDIIVHNFENLEQILDKLIEQANNNGGQDNITVLLTKV